MLIKKTKRLYRVFGSGSYHAPYAIFSRFSKRDQQRPEHRPPQGCRHKDGRLFLCDAPVSPSQACIEGHDPLCAVERLQAGTAGDQCGARCRNACFLEGYLCGCPCVFPALKALRLADSNRPGMDKIYYLAYKTEDALEKSAMDLDDKELFPTPSEDDTEEDDGDDDDDEESRG